MSRDGEAPARSPSFQTLGDAGPLAPSAGVAEDLARHAEAKSQLAACTAVIYDFLQSKGLFSAERALRMEIELNYHREASYRNVIARNLWQSKLENMLGVHLPRGGGGGDDSPDMAVLLSQVGSVRDSRASRGQTPTNWSSHNAMQHDRDVGASCRSTPSRRLGVRLHQLHPSLGEEEGQMLRKQRSRSAQQSCVVFREGTPMSEQQAAAVSTLPLPLLYNPYIRGLEDSPELAIDESIVIAGRYKVNALIGKGSFSRVVQCYDMKERKSVSVKVLHNDKDCVDQGIGEVRLLSLLRERDMLAEVPIVRLHDYFYYKEHLLIVTELLRDSIFNFYRYLRDTSPEGHGAYFTLDTLRTLSVQLLSALGFMHQQNIVH
jgi:hypothetical protein